MRQINFVIYSALIGVLVSSATFAEAPLEYGSQPMPPQPEIRDLGGQRYQVGSIEVNKAERNFAVPGKVIRSEPPLEFLAVTKGGYKSYESLLELDANAVEFNLACILIGLDAKKAKPASFHFDKEPVAGDKLELWITWESSGKTVRRRAEELLTAAEGQATHEWVYTGSTFTPDGRYLAHMDGTLIGFVHDPASIIEHRVGIGLGAFGTIEARKNVLPPVGTPIRLLVRKSN